MSYKSTALIARKSIRARIGRLIGISIAIVVGVSFVVGSFVLADSLRNTFDNLFTQITENVDLEVRSSVAFESDAGEIDQRDPIPASLADEVAAVEGVAATEPLLQRYAQLVDKEGAAITTGGAPTLGVAWTGDSSLSGLEIKGDGAPPVGPDQVAIDKATADREDFVVGDTITVLTDTGSNDFTITALVGLGDTDGFAGATLAAWDVSTAADVLDAGDSLDGVDVAVAEGADVATVQSRIEEILPPGTEVITRDVLVEENKADLDVFIDAFQTGLLIFAFITAFVSAFLINNVFQITIGQRLRELALLRAVGASGTQVRRMIYVEALVMSIIATAIGIGGGVLVAKLMLSLFNSAGLGFPDAGTVLMPRSIIMAVVVGVGITLLSVIVPARRAAKIPPVAAMRPELGFEALSTRRLVVGTTVAVLGAVMFVLGLFLRPGGAARADRACRCRRAHDLPRRCQRVVHGGPACDEGHRLAGGQGARYAGRPRPGERRAGATADIGDCRRSDDRRRAGQRRRGVRLLAAGDVHGHPRGRRPGRLHRHRRVLPRAATDRGRNARRGPRAVRRHTGAHGGRPDRWRSAQRRRRRSARRGATAQPGCDRGRLPGRRRWRHSRQRGHCRRPRLDGWRHRGDDVPERG